MKNHTEKTDVIKLSSRKSAPATRQRLDCQGQEGRRESTQLCTGNPKRLKNGRDRGEG